MWGFGYAPPEKVTVNGLIPFADYPVRPAMELGESLAGYVYRYLGDNGHTIGLELLRELRAIYKSEHKVAVQAIKVIQPLFGEKIIFDLNIWLNQRQHNSIYKKDKEALNIFDVSFCPMCLKNEGIHLSLWERTLVHACPVHQYALLDACTACGKPFKWLGLLPNWRCRCNEPIMGMQPSFSKAGRIALAQLIAHSTDVNLPNGIKHQLGSPTCEPYQLVELYDALTVGCEFVKIVKTNKEHVKTNPVYRDFRSVLPLPRVAWFAKMLCDPKVALTNRLRRWILRLYFRKPGSAINIIKKNDVMVHCCNFVDQQPNSVFKIKLVRVIKRCIFTHRVKLALSLMFVFDPRLNKTEIKASLMQFGEWWLTLSDQMEILDSRVHSAWHTQQNAKTNALYSGQLIFEILQTLLKASQSYVDVGTFYALTHLWHIPESLRKPTPTVETLNKVCEHLIILPISEVNFIYDLVRLCTEKQRK